MPIAIKIFNGFTLILIYGLVGFLGAAFYLGTEESHQNLVNMLPGSFVLRFSGFAFLGMLLIGMLALVNYIFNRTFLKGHEKTNIKKLLLNSMILMSIMAFLGTVSFFYA